MYDKNNVEIELKKLKRYRNIPEIDFNYRPGGSKIRLDEIEKVETLIKNLVDRYLFDNFERLVYSNGYKLEFPEFTMLREGLILELFVDWVNKCFDTDLMIDRIEFIIHSYSDLN